MQRGLGGHDQLEADRADDQDGAEHDQRLHRAGDREQDGGKAEQAGQHVGDGDGLLLAEAHVDKPVVNVAAVGLHRALVVRHAADDREADVKDRQAQDQEGHGKGDDRVGLKQALDRDRGKDEAQEGGARVAHEDLGRVEVIGHEAEAGAGQSRHHDGDLRIRDHEGNDQQVHRRDRGDAAGQTVEAVDKVDRVRDRNDPDDRDRIGPHAEIPVGIVAAAEGIRDAADADVAVEDHDAGGQELYDELELGAEGILVVKDAEDDDDDGAEQDRGQAAVDLPGKRQNGQEKRQEDRQAAHAGDRHLVHPAVVLRDVHDTHLLREHLDKRRGPEGDHKRTDQRQAGADHEV